MSDVAVWPQKTANLTIRADHRTIIGQFSPSGDPSAYELSAIRFTITTDRFTIS
jgi:hypothetical protein